MPAGWTDERLDDFADRVNDLARCMDDGFNRVDADIRLLRSETNARFDSMQRTMIQAVVAMTTAMLSGFAAIFGLIATQL